MNIAVIVPVYNEEKYIGLFLKELLPVVKKHKEIKEVIIVDDGSTDKTSSILGVDKSSYTILRHSRNKGKGAAMKKGLDYASSYDAVIFMDGDLQHEPRYLPQFISSLKEYPLVFGYRHLKTDAPWLRKVGNMLAAWIIHNMFGIKRDDLLCGYLAIRKDVYKETSWHSNDYGVEAELSAIVGRKQIPFKEIHIKTIYLDPKKGMNFWHAVWILLKLPWWYLRK